jgi:hypothetical protein
MKCQFLIGNAEHPLNDGSANHLFSRHPASTGSSGLAANIRKILYRQIADGRVDFQNVADVFQLYRLRVIGCRGHQWHLFSTLFAHFVVAPFFILVVILIGCKLTSHYQIRYRNELLLPFLITREAYPQKITTLSFWSQLWETVLGSFDNKPLNGF